MCWLEQGGVETARPFSERSMVIMVRALSSQMEPKRGAKDRMYERARLAFLPRELPFTKVTRLQVLLLQQVGGARRRATNKRPTDIMIRT